MDPYAPCLWTLVSHWPQTTCPHLWQRNETKRAPGSLEESNSASFQGHIGPKGSLLLCAAVSAMATNATQRRQWPVDNSHPLVPGATNIYCIDCESPVIWSLQSTLCLLLLCVSVHACLHASTELNWSSFKLALPNQCWTPRFVFTSLYPIFISLSFTQIAAMGSMGSGARNLRGTDLRPSPFHHPPISAGAFRGTLISLESCGLRDNSQILQSPLPPPLILSERGLGCWVNLKTELETTSICWVLPKHSFCDALTLILSTRLVTFHTWTTRNGSKYRTSQTCPTLPIRHRRMTCTRMRWRKPSTLLTKKYFNQKTEVLQILNYCNLQHVIPPQYSENNKVIFRIEFHAQKCLLV